MEQRKIIDERIRVQIDFPKDYKESFVCTWEKLQSLQNILPSDKVIGLGFFEEKKGGGFGISEEEAQETVYVPCLVIIRPRPETDEEYLKRMRDKEEFISYQEEKERLEFLRLKAKFEPDGRG